MSLLARCAAVCALSVLPALPASAATLRAVSVHCVPSGPGRASSLSTDGTNVVWISKRGRSASIRGESLPAGRLFEVTTRGTVALGLGGPAISGPYVAWVDCRRCVASAGLPGFRNTGIYVRNFAAGPSRLVSPPGHDAFDPALDGSTVVWVAYEGRRTDIFARNLNTWRLSRVTSSGTATVPAISGNIVVWQDRRSGGWNVYGKDLRSGREFVVARHQGGRVYPENAVISGHVVVWSTWHGSQSIAINGENLLSGRRFAVATIPAGHYNPQLGPTVGISGNIVAWDETRNSATSRRPEYEVLISDLATQHKFIVAGPHPGIASPAVSEAVVVWVSKGRVCNRRTGS